MTSKKQLDLNRYSFWVFQLGGWLIFYAADIALMYATRSKDMREFYLSCLETPLLFLYSFVVRAYYRKIDHRSVSIRNLLVQSAVTSILVTTIWYITISYMFAIFYDPRWFNRVITVGNVIYCVSYLSPILFGWSILYFGIKFWLDWLSEKERAKQAALLAQQAQLLMLRYQVNPHFLFNALNSVRALIEEDPRNAKMMITELSEFLRYSLVNRDSATVILGEELDAIRHYLSIEKKRFEDKLEITYDIDKSAEVLPVLNFLLHPLVENALKYGMQTSAMPLRLGITAKSENGWLHLTVTNSGTWLDQKYMPTSGTGGTGTGVENVKARLENAYRGNYTLNRYEKNGSVVVDIRIPTKPEAMDTGE
jgi:LytS/YehU family sensor histidine kinase